MEQYTQAELEEALRAINSTIGKCEKVRPKLRPGTPQHTLLVRRIRAFHIASRLIERELDPGADTQKSLDTPRPITGDGQ